MALKVLLIEDDPDLQELLSFNLKKRGYQVATASDGIAGIRKVRSLGPDVVLLDIMLPELDGFSVCETLRQDPATRATKIIVMSALTGEFVRYSSAGCGADRFLRKPLSFDEVQKHIEHLTAKPASPEPHKKTA